MMGSRSRELRSDRTQTLFHQSFTERELVAIGAHCSEISHSIQTVPKRCCYRGTSGRDSVVVHTDPGDLKYTFKTLGFPSESCERFNSTRSRLTLARRGGSPRFQPIENL